MSFRGRACGTMADETERSEWVHRNVDADLQFIFQEAEVPEQIQYDLGQHYKSVRRFSALADDRAGVRQALQADYNIRADSAPNRSAVASVVAAWDTAKHAHEEDIKMRQEAKGLGTVRPLPHTDRSAMLRAVETAKGEEISEKDQPSTDYVAMLLEEIEQDEVTAHPLDEVVNRKDAQSLQLQSSLDQSGRVRITRQRPKGKLPVNTEELRQKLRVEGNAWLMIAAKLRNKVYLRGLQQRHFDRYVDYLLGEKCYGMLIPGPAGEKVPLSPPWHIMLDYEFELRKKAVRRAHRSGRPLDETLQEVTEDAEIKELYFTSPVTFSAMQRPAKFSRVDEPQTRFGEGGKSKGKGKKGKSVSEGKGKSKKGSFLPGTNLSLVSHTPDGKEICYRFNMRGKACDGTCNRAHVCRVKNCNAAHPAFDHPKAGGSS